MTNLVRMNIVTDLQYAMYTNIRIRNKSDSAIIAAATVYYGLIDDGIFVSNIGDLSVTVFVCLLLFPTRVRRN